MTTLGLRTTSALDRIFSLSVYPTDFGLSNPHNCISQFLKVHQPLSLLFIWKALIHHSLPYSIIKYCLEYFLYVHFESHQCYNFCFNHHSLKNSRKKGNLQNYPYFYLPCYSFLPGIPGSSLNHFACLKNSFSQLLEQACCDKFLSFI